MKPCLRLTLITLTVGGGFTGFVQTLWSLFDPENQETSYKVIMMAFLLLYAFVTLSGLLFVQNHQQTWPLRVALRLQVPWISSPVIAYQFVSGFHVTVGLAGGYINADSWLGSGWTFYFFTEFPWGFGINLFAIFMLVLLARSMRTSNIVLPSRTVVPSLPYTFVDEIDRVVQRRLVESDMHDHSVHVYSQADGKVAIAVNNKVYGRVSMIEDAAIRDLVQGAIDEWQENK
jgi:hypothetical protein